MRKVDESILKISRDPRCPLTFIAHQPCNTYGEAFALSIHEDSLRPLVSEEAWALLDTGEELNFKLVEMDKHKDLQNSAKVAAKWMRWWINERECECEGRHSCGKDEREAELIEIEKVIKLVELE